MHVAATAVCLTGFAWIACAPGEADAQSRRTGWYIGGGVGLSGGGAMHQAGWNRDAYCYPDSCREPGLSQDIPGAYISGYRWEYELPQSVGSALEVALGRMFGPLRLEISAAQRKNNLDQQFLDASHLDGRPNVNLPDVAVASDIGSSVGGLTARGVFLNAYYDLVRTPGRVTPYLGGGLGIASFEISDVLYFVHYRGASDPPEDLSFYNSRQETDMTGTALAGNLYAGADYRLNTRTLLGVKCAWSIADGFSYEGDYRYHPVHREDPDFTSQTDFTGLRQWSAMLVVKYRLL